MNKEIVASTMKLKLVSGKDAKEQPVYATKSFKGINPALSDDDMLAIGMALSTLQSLPLADVLRTDITEMSA